MIWSRVGWPAVPPTRPTLRAPAVTARRERVAQRDAVEPGVEEGGVEGVTGAGGVDGADRGAAALDDVAVRGDRERAGRRRP